MFKAEKIVRSYAASIFEQNEQKASNSPWENEIFLHRIFGAFGLIYSSVDPALHTKVLRKVPTTGYQVLNIVAGPCMASTEYTNKLSF